MRRFIRGSRPFLCILQSVLLLLGSPALAATSYSSETERVGRYEQTLFGATRSSLPLDIRLRALESNVFGKSKQGSTNARLDAIGRLLGDQKSSLLLPPIAPQLERPEAEPAPDDRAIADFGGDDAQAPARVEPVSRSANGAKELLRQAVQKYSEGNTVEAEKLFRKVLAADPNNGDANYNLGAIAESKGDLDGALGYYKKARTANPSDTEIQQAVAALERQIQDRRDTAARAQAGQRALAQKEQRKTELKKLADNAASAYRNKNYDEAIRNLDIVAREAPGDAEVQYALAQAWRGKGDNGRARDHLQQAMSIDPSNPLYRNTLADLDKDDRGSQVANSPQDNTPPGQITPFENVDSGSSYDGPYHRHGGGGIGGMMSGLLPGMGYSSVTEYGGYGPRVSYSGTRIKRAVIGGLAGAAIGGFMGRGTGGGVKSGALKGAIFGGMAGLLFGGY